MWRIGLALLAIAALVGTAAAQARSTASGTLSIHVSGNRLLDGAGHEVQLRGVNRSGFEFACVQGWGLMDGPTDATSIAAMKTWDINVVRVPLNEGCWLGLTSVPAKYRGAVYRQAVAGYVKRLTAAGLYVILDLHWNAPGSRSPNGQQVMADASHSPAFWKSVATTFSSNHAVIFDLYNEPHDVSWSCWKAGCTTGGWATAGMQSLVNAVRSTGAKQPLMLGGLGYAGDLSHWLAFEPADPLHQLVASLHTYKFVKYGTTGCLTACRKLVLSVAAHVPVVTGEMGEDDCAHGFLDSYMPWADAQKPRISYVGWTWNTWDCSSGPALITDYNGTPTSFGVGLRDHLQALG